MIFVVLIIVVLFIIFAMGKRGTGIHDIYKDLVLANNDNRLGFDITYLPNGMSGESINIDIRTSFVPMLGSISRSIGDPHYCLFSLSHDVPEELYNKYMDIAAESNRHGRSFDMHILPCYQGKFSVLYSLPLNMSQNSKVLVNGIIDLVVRANALYDLNTRK